MVDPNRPNQSLARRVQRLEALLLALLASESSEAADRGGLLDAIFHSLNRGLRSSNDSELLHVLRRLVDDRSRMFHADRSEADERARTYFEELAAEYRSRFEVLETRFEKRLIETLARSDDVHHLAAAASEQTRKLGEEFRTNLALASLGVDADSVPVQRYVPLRLYLSAGDDAKLDSIQKAVMNVARKFGLEVADDFPAETGSWWKRWTTKTKDVLTHPELVDRLKKLERAVELKGIHHPQSEITRNEAEATAALIKSVESIPRVALQIGSILLVKALDHEGKSVVHARTLTQEQLIYLEKNPRALASPEEILSSLASFSDTQLAKALCEIPEVSHDLRESKPSMLEHQKSDDSDIPPKP